MNIARDDIAKNHAETKSWKITGDLFGVSKAAARRIAMGIDPGEHVRKQLKMSNVAYVIAINGGIVPPGTQVIAARQCECGKWFIPNTATRRKCFECNAPRSKT